MSRQETHEDNNIKPVQQKQFSVMRPQLTKHSQKSVKCWESRALAQILISHLGIDSESKGYISVLQSWFYEEIESVEHN